MFNKTSQRMRYWAMRFFFPCFIQVGKFFHQFYKLWERLTFNIIFQFCEFLSISSTLPLCSLSMSNTLPPIFWFFSSVFYQVRRLFIKLILTFFSSVSHWVRRFFIHHVLSSFTLVRLYAQRSSRPKKNAIVIL